MQDTVDWGIVVPEGGPDSVATVSANVVLKNNGTEILRISEVRPGCGCTTAPLDKDSLVFGEETTMRIKLNLPSHNGPVHKVITVSSNDPVNPQKVLHLVANVQRPLQMSSSFIPFNKGKVGKPVEGKITFTYKGKESVVLRATSQDPNFVILTTMPVILNPDVPQDLIVTHTPKQSGAFRAQFTIETNLKGYEKFTVHGYGNADP